MAVDAVEGIDSIKREDGAALLESKGSNQRHDLHSASDRHAVIAPESEIASQLLSMLEEEYGVKHPSEDILAGDHSHLYVYY